MTEHNDYLIDQIHNNLDQKQNQKHKHNHITKMSEKIKDKIEELNKLLEKCEDDEPIVEDMIPQIQIINDRSSEVLKQLKKRHIMSIICIEPGCNKLQLSFWKGGVNGYCSYHCEKNRQYYWY